MHIDLDADLGEALPGLVGPANIACGWCTGDAGTMQQCVRWPSVTAAPR